MLNDPLVPNNYCGSAKCTDENLEFFIDKVRELNTSGVKFTFWQWTSRMMPLLDLFD